MNDHLRRAVRALEVGAAEARDLAAVSAPQVRARLRRTVEEVLDHLEADEQEAEPEDVFTSLDRKSQEIAEELRRAERLMRERTGQG